MHRSGGYSGIIFATRRHARRGTSPGSARHTDALQTRGDLIRHLRLPCGLPVGSTAKRGCRRGPSANSASFLYPSAFTRPRRWRRGGRHRRDAIGAKKNRALPYARRPHLRRRSFAESFVQFGRGLLVELRLVVHTVEDGHDVCLEDHSGHHDLVEDVVDLVGMEN